ncbi:LPS assembly lipoprotein LptE [Niveispirillum irakense]|uniref:LPS assembly lipoprotein LptE n=1 Tax=Niveispirillum irakense TaxID=34011 RepID=UPI0003F5EDA2|nr:LPS assembly lipoprotein LptE [Niveispirillum irakense]
MSKRLIAAALIALLPLAGCGFQPVYGTRAGGVAAGQSLAQVQIDPIPERNGQVLRNNLIDRFYTDSRPSDPRYRLSIALSAVEEELGIQKDATATRARLRLQANYELIDNTNSQVVYRTSSRSVVSYNLLDSQFAVLASKQDAYDRGLTELAEDIRSRLGLYFARESEKG